jgi:hypothetical protein
MLNLAIVSSDFIARVNDAIERKPIGYVETQGQLSVNART